ncbi:MAG: SDR family oxidoreductase [Anaerolineae bacterium]|nr:SDR family oxidoreductase [Anaerolineae bacterium]
MKPNILKDKVAIITGAGRGIGRSIALTLAAHGARVALAAHTAVESDAVRAEIESIRGTDFPVCHPSPPRALCITTDISREGDVITLVRDTIATFGRLDIVVNNAGIGVFGPLAQTSTAGWDRVMAVNARGTFLVCRETIPYLRKQHSSFIINIASVVSVKGYANQAAYSASKHAVIGMTKALAKEVQADGIRVHAICPGGVDTDMAGQARPDLDRSILIKPEEIADIVLFLVTRSGNAVIDAVSIRRAASTPWE